MALFTIKNMAKEELNKKRKKKKKCVVCKKNLKVIETNLCSCKLNVCMKHRNRNSHRCELSVKMEEMEKIVAVKVNKI